MSSISFEVGQHGWGTLRIEAAPAVADVRVSYINDIVDDLCACAEALIAGSSAEFSWDSEPEICIVNCWASDAGEGYIQFSCKDLQISIQSGARDLARDVTLMLMSFNAVEYGKTWSQIPRDRIERLKLSIGM